LFQAIAGAIGTANWRSWPAGIAAREPRAIDDARHQVAMDVLRHQYLQWIADEQWQSARRAVRAQGVLLVGDAPFVVATDSADVWARSGEFVLEASAGVPPDAFSATGQDWGLPMYRWDVIAAGGFAWMRDRVRRMAALYDGIRLDHLVGFYRSYGRIGNGDGFFIPPDEPTQTWQGEQILRIAIDAGIEVLAEDLGTVPDFVRASMARLCVPGLKVLRWERDYHAASQPFLDPATFPPVSVTMTGTHDTETMAAWWEAAPTEERRAFAAMPSCGGRLDPLAPWSDRVRDLLIDVAYHAGSDHLFLPMQDVFGWRDRINTPATVNALNWTWKLPWASDELTSVPEAVERARVCRELAAATGRLAAPASE
jgi:4-alpha-glucanotransferase